MSHNRLKLLGLVMGCLLLAGLMYGQSIFGSLTGLVTDASNAVVPSAKITLTNEASGDTRRTETNTDGYFSITSIPTGSYTIAVEAQGFQKWERKAITFTGAERRTLNDIVLQVAGTAEQVQVTATVEGIAPVESGEKAAVLQRFRNFGRCGALELANDGCWGHGRPGAACGPNFEGSFPSPGWGWSGQVL